MWDLVPIRLLALVPVMLQEKFMSAPVPVLVTVSVLGELVKPTFALPK